MPERRKFRLNGAAKGSAKKVKIEDDLSSVLVHEIVEELNFSEFQQTKTLLTVANTTTRRESLGLWRYDMFIKDIAFINQTAAAIVGATTVVRLRYADKLDADLVNGPATPTDLLVLNGFNAGAGWGSGDALWGNEFVVGTNVAAKTGKDRGIHIPAGKVLYFEVVNNEGAAVNIGAICSMALTNYLDLQPRSAQATPFKLQRNFQRSKRQA